MEAAQTVLSKYHAYKDSGEAWLGEIPEHWEVSKLKFHTSISKGKLPKKIVTQNEINLPPYMSMEYLRGGEENQWVFDSTSIILEEGEILLLWDGSNAGEFIKSRKGVISSTVAHIKFRGIQQNYAWYLSKRLEIEIRSTTIGMGIPHVNGQALINLSLILPPLPEQSAIAAFLDEKTAKIDQAIAQKERLIELLKERKQILIQELVTGKKVWNEATQSWVKPKETVDSGVEWIGEIPKGWEIKRVASCLRQTNFSGEEGLSVLSVSIHSAVSDRELSDEENLRGTIRSDDKTLYKKVENGDVVYNMMRAWQGAIGAVSITGMVSPAYITARFTRPFNSSYFEHLFRTPDFINVMNQYSRGITDFRKRLYWNEFKQLPILNPPLREQNRIVDFIHSFSIKTDRSLLIYQSQITQLKEYKAVLIDSAVTGKVKVC